MLCWLNSANAYAAKKSLQHKPLSANLPGVLSAKVSVVLFFGLAAQSHGTPAACACTHVCMYGWMDVCMYVRTYFLKCSYVLD